MHVSLRSGTYKPENVIYHGFFPQSRKGLQRKEMADVPPHLNRMTMFCQSRSEITVQVNMSVSLGPPDLL